MGSVYRRKKAKRGSLYYIKYRDHTGKWVHEAAYTDKQASAQLLAKRERMVARQEQGLEDPFKEHRRMPLSEHVDDFETHLKARGCTHRYVRSTKGRLLKALAGMGATFPDDMSGHKAERFVLSLRDGTEKKAGLSAKGSNNYVANLKQFGNWGVERGRWATNPFKGLKKLNVEADRRRVRRALTVPELRRVIETARVRGVAKYRENHGHIAPDLESKLVRLGEERAVIYEVAALTGLRLNELTTLEWRHVDFDKAPATITIAAEYSKSRRVDTILLHEAVSDQLMDWRHRRIEELGHSPSPKDRVFNIAQRLTAQFKKDCKFAGVPLEDGAGRVVDFHSLRHTFAQLLVKQNVHPRTAQTMLRHRDIRTTMKVYVRDDQTAQKQALASLPSLSDRNQVHHMVHHAGCKTRQGEATPCNAMGEDEGRKSFGYGAYGKNMQEAAALGSDLQVVAGEGFEPPIFRL